MQKKRDKNMSRLVEINISEIQSSNCVVCGKSDSTMIFLSECSECRTSVMCCDDCYDIMGTSTKMDKINQSYKCASCKRNEKIETIIK